MNRKSYTKEQSEKVPPSFFGIEKNKGREVPAEVTMSDIARKLRSVYAQMQMKHPSRHLASQSSIEESFKSYLDDISRAILAEHYIRRQKEKKLFESLEQLKSLVQSLHSEKKSPEKSAVPGYTSRSNSFDSVVQKLADMPKERDQEYSSLHKMSHISKKSDANLTQANVKNVLQKENKASLSMSAINSSSKEAERLFKHSTIKEKRSDIQESDHDIENDHSSSSVQSRRHFFVLGYYIKKILWCFLIIAFIFVITLCSYSFFKEVRFFNF
ncbi:hypothetical protein ABID23_001286 [Bartonella silvatica]|uniref:Uncharacterized protein n=1 Tax=Bartonella silvatica TaxID=357760 RepID=A0ABV2HHZ6_9HYPH